MNFISNYVLWYKITKGSLGLFESVNCPKLYYTYITLVEMKFILIIQFSTTKFKNYGANISKTYTVQN